MYSDKLQQLLYMRNQYMNELKVETDPKRVRAITKIIAVLNKLIAQRAGL